MSFSKEKGSISLYIAAVVLPILFFLFSLSIDVGAYVTETQAVQKIADETSLYASRHLPAVVDAENALNSYLENLDIALVSNGEAIPEGFTRAAVVDITSDRVQVKLSANVPMPFSSILLGILAGENQSSITTSARAVSKATPLDVMIAMDLSHYLSPNVLTGTAWNSDSQWPAAQFFKAADIRYNGTTLDARVLTQQCFNSAISQIKNAVIRSYELLSSFKNNAVGLSFFPGTGRTVFVSRRVSSFNPSLEIGNTGEAAFQMANQEIIAAGPYSSDEWCAASAEQEALHADYQFPSGNTNLRNVNRDSAPNSIISPVNNKFDPEYARYLEAREVVWSKAVQPNVPGNFVEVIRSLRTKLIGAEAFNLRANLAAYANKSAIVFIGDLPFGFAGVQYPNAQVISDIQSEIELLKEDVFTYGFNLQLYLIGMNHLGNSNTFDTNGLGLRTFIEAFSEAERSEQQGSFIVHMLYGDDAVYLANQVSSAILARQRTSLLVE
ncbi:MAG: hypothetical protein R3A13_06195 [Bdellovibrionota bacterium]